MYIVIFLHYPLQALHVYCIFSSTPPSSPTKSIQTASDSAITTTIKKTKHLTKKTAEHVGTLTASPNHCQCDESQCWEAVGRKVVVRGVHQGVLLVEPWASCDTIKSGWAKGASTPEEFNPKLQYHSSHCQSPHSTGCVKIWLVHRAWRNKIDRWGEMGNFCSAEFKSIGWVKTCHLERQM